jgi:O-acetyl-ADP-ribose deacetylase
MRECHSENMTNSIRIADTTITAVQGDITEQDTEAIVNAANSTLLGGGGVDGAIHRVGGPSILEECRRIRATTYPRGLPTGDAVITTAGALPARRVVHTVGPIWQDGRGAEAELLARAYRNSMRVAAEEGLRTIAFPSVSTGAYGYPTERAAQVAVRAVQETIHALPNAFDEVRFVLFSQRDFAIYSEALQHLAQH